MAEMTQESMRMSESSFKKKVDDAVTANRYAQTALRDVREIESHLKDIACVIDEKLEGSDIEARMRSRASIAGAATFRDCLRYFREIFPEATDPETITAAVTASGYISYQAIKAEE